MSQLVFNIIAENVQEQHIPKQVHPAGVEKHRRDQRDDWPQVKRSLATPNSSDLFRNNSEAVEEGFELSAER